MDNSTKALLVLGLAGTAFVTGAAVQNSIRDRDEELEHVREQHRELEQKVREQRIDIDHLEREKDSLRRQISNLDARVNGT